MRTMQHFPSKCHTHWEWFNTLTCIQLHDTLHNLIWIVCAEHGQAHFSINNERSLLMTSSCLINLDICDRSFFPSSACGKNYNSGTYFLFSTLLLLSQFFRICIIVELPFAIFARTFFPLFFPSHLLTLDNSLNFRHLQTLSWVLRSHCTRA